MNTLVPIQKAELAVGMPLPWPVFDVSNQLLMNEGVVIQDHRQLDALYERGAYRNPVEAIKQQAKAALGEARPASAAKNELSFSDMKLRLGDRLQLQEVTGDKARHLAKVVGYLDGHSLIVTHPSQGGKPLVFLDRQQLIVRGFSGKHAFAFQTHLLKFYPAPYPHLHLATPKHVEQKEIRGSERIPCDIVASVAPADDSARAPRAAVMVDLSITGTKFVAEQVLGEKGDAVTVTFRGPGNISSDQLTLRGVIRYINPDGEEGGVSHGVEFSTLRNTERLVLENMIYRLRFDEI